MLLDDINSESEIQPSKVLQTAFESELTIFKIMLHNFTIKTTNKRIKVKLINWKKVNQITTISKLRNYWVVLRLFFY